MYECAIFCGFFSYKFIRLADELETDELEADESTGHRNRILPKDLKFCELDIVVS